MWCVPKLDKEFRQRMEDVLDCYKRPYNPKEPLIGVDELSKQLLADTRPGRACRPGTVATYDYEYTRNGTRNLFIMTEPKTAWRKVKTTRRRCKNDFAKFMKDISEKQYPNAKRIHVVLDNLNTHFEKSFIETFGPRQGKKIWKRFVFHYTPKHASWLNVAENEISALQRQCLNRRIPSERELKKETQAWCRDRNKKRVTIDWKFDKKKARTTFPELYS